MPEPNLKKFVFTVFIFLLLTGAMPGCASPGEGPEDSTAKRPHSHSSSESLALNIDLQEGVNPAYKYAGSCRFPDGFCVQVYSPELLDGMTMLVLMVKDSSCRLVRSDEGEKICQDQRNYGRCLFRPQRPGGSPPGTLVQMDLFYQNPPDANEKASCNEKGTFYSAR